MKVTRALWKKEIDACAWMILENGRGQSGMRGVVAEGEVVGAVGAVEEVLTMIVADALETVAGAAGVEYVSNAPNSNPTDSMFHSVPGPDHDPGPGRLEGEGPLLVIPLSVREVLGPVLSALPEGIARQEGTRTHAQGPALPHLAGVSVPSPPHLPANVNLVLAARSEIAVVPLPAEGVTRLMTILDHVVEALAMGRAGVVEAPPLHDVESGASPDLLPRKAGGAKEVQATAAAALVVNLPVTETAWTPIAVA